MILEFEEPRWRFESPGTLGDAAVREFIDLITRVSSQSSNRQDVYESFKSEFSTAAGEPHSISSSENWAYSDLKEMMYRAAENAALFLEAFFNACHWIQESHQDWAVPNIEDINQICNKHNAGYVIESGNPPKLHRIGELIPSVPIEQEATVLEVASEEFREAISRSEDLLSQGKAREAVQNLLWVLESVATAFRGVVVEGTEVRGHYFNRIIRELRGAAEGRILEQALGWLDTLHGYLSAPKGGGIRHGLDLNSDPITDNEARLFCNLIRSYIHYLLHEHARLSRQ